MKKKGYLYTIEVLIVVAIIIVVAVFLFRSPPDRPNTEITLMKQKLLWAVDYMYTTDLRQLVFDDNADVIIQRLSDMLPGIEIDACVDCDKNIDANNVATVQYYFSGIERYEARMLRIYAWRKNS
ncbi:MAG: hypothetical protein ABIG30_02435 [Candidatus Aenigmatarchaeota archaeon]